MKLYTEDQLKYVFKTSRALDDHTNNFVYGSFDEIKFDGELTPIEIPSDTLCINCDESKSTHNICMDCIIKVGKQNIELPSDEDIEDAALSFCNSQELSCDTSYYGFLGATQWLLNIIQRDNK